MSARNWPLLIETMQFILDHPEQWDQTVWANLCGTAYCFAGHASLLAGAKQLRGREIDPDSYNPDEWTEWVTVPDSIAAALDESAHCGWWHETVDDRKAYEMSDVGEVALGLSRSGDLDLFDSDNQLGDLLAYLRAMAKEDGVELPESWPTDAPCRTTRTWGSSIDEY